MLAKKFLIVGLAIGILGSASWAFAQSDDSKPKTIGQRLDKFGKTIFGGILPAEKPKANPNPKPSTMASPQLDDGYMARRPAQAQVQRDDSEDEPVTSRSGNVITRHGRSPALTDRTLPDTEGLTPENAPLVPRRPVKKAAEPVVEEPVAEKPSTPGLHERLSNFRQSAFDSDDEGEPTAQPVGQPEPKANAQPYQPRNEQPYQPRIVESNVKPKAQPFAQPRIVGPNAPVATQTAQPATQADVPPEETFTAPAKEEVKERDLTPAATYSPESRPLIAQRVAPSVRPAQPISDADPGSAGIGSVVVESRQPSRQNPQPTSRTNGDDVLFARKSPVISVETLGPRTISVGMESTYQVHLRNSGDVAADDLALTVTLPDWAEVLGINATIGDTQMPETTRGGSIRWKVGHVDAKSQQKLTIRLVPRQNRPFDLGVRWESKAISTQAMIDVQEPKLSLKIEGPREVQYGKKEVYRLKLTNTGNGNAENVVLVLTPVGTGDNVPASHKVGLLPAGEDKTLDVELTARQAGTLTIQAEAHADHGVRTELEEKVIVHRAALKLDLDGPKVQFVGSVANYVVRIRNTGTAPARNIHFTILLPNGAKYLSGVDGVRRSSSSNKLEWLLENLGPDVEQNFTLRCALGTPGLGKARVYTTAEDDLMATAETIVQIDSVANLTMEVKDPTGPVPVGEESVYEIRIRNRGTREAESVEVFGYFSRGIEPIGAEGGPNRLGPGQVVYQPLPSLAPGAEAVLKIRARADAAGNHVFRAEARCKPLNARLVSEATNLYYTDGPADPQGTQTAGPSQSQQPAAAYDAMRTTPAPTSNELTPLLPRK